MEAGRGLRHLRPRWDVHRHRMAPRIAAGVGAGALAWPGGSPLVMVAAPVVVKSVPGVRVMTVGVTELMT